jgi:peptidase E
MARRPQIVAFGGGGFSMEPGNRLLDDHVLGLTGVERPRVCFLPTASGDADVLCGLSAGSLCWFSEAITAFHGSPQRIDGLGLLPWSNCVHYDGEPCRRSAYLGAVLGGMAPGYAAGDGAALHFVGSELAGVVTSRPGAGAYRVDVADGAARETPLPAVSLRDERGLVAA